MCPVQHPICPVETDPFGGLGRNLATDIVIAVCDQTLTRPIHPVLVEGMAGPTVVIPCYDMADDKTSCPLNKPMMKGFYQDLPGTLAGMRHPRLDIGGEGSIGLAPAMVIAKHRSPTLR